MVIKTLFTQVCFKLMCLKGHPYNTPGLCPVLTPCLGDEEFGLLTFIHSLHPTLNGLVPACAALLTPYYSRCQLTEIDRCHPQGIKGLA